jgi:small subunit ribosomal protein S16
MSVSIRLRREGSLNNPYYKVVVADSRSPRDGKFIEIIGTYDPTKPGHNSTLKLDRAEYWIGKGAQPSDTVRSLIKKNKEHAAKPAAEKTSASSARPEPPPAAAAPAETAPPVSVPAEPAPPPPSAGSDEPSAS